MTRAQRFPRTPRRRLLPVVRSNRIEPATSVEGRVQSKGWSFAVGVFGLMILLTGCASGSRQAAVHVGAVPSTRPGASMTTGTATTATLPAATAATATSGAQGCRTAQVLLSAQWEPGAVPYGTDPAHRHYATELFGRITAVNNGPPCVMSGAPVVSVVSYAGAVLKVPSEPAGQWCQFSCDAPQQLTLARGAVVFAGMHWSPSFCAPDPGGSVRLRVALSHSTVTTIPVRNLGGAGKPIHAPSCTPALAQSRLSVERFGQHEG